ncbi:MAG: hypothetical protein HUK03_09710, partial [Bacteroidaceae bacterium]|nr:hypothetical protein [Bacteroidaceae bacterium]
REATLTGDYQWQPSRWCLFNDAAIYESIDTLHTDEEGRFTLRIPVSGKVEQYHYGMWLRAHVSVTSPDGETHEGKTSLSLCSRKIRLDGTTNVLLHRRHPAALTLTAYSSSEREMQVPVRLRLYKGQELVREQTVSSGTPADLSWLAAQTPARYTWRAEAVYEGDTARWNHSFLLCDEAADTLPTDTALWCYCPADTFGVGRPAVLQIGSSLPDAYAYITYAYDGHSTDTVMCLNGTTHIDLPYQPHYGQSLTISIALVRDEELYTYGKTLLLEMPSMQLRHRWETFRDRVRPGQEEQWTLVLTRPDGTPADASLMATMYDASLDVFSRHRLSYTPWLSHYVNSLWWQASPSSAESLYFSLELNKRKVDEWTFTRLDERYFNRDAVEEAMPFTRTANRNIRVAGVMPMMSRTKALAVQTMEEADMTVDSAAPQLFAANADQGAGTATAEPEEKEVEEESETSAVSMRSNFAETAFFMPSLVTDAQGRVSLRFTLPESLTRWHLTGFAHTQDMLCATLDEQVVARKELMGELRLPRFLRQGDKAVLTATINNVSESVQ